MKLNYFLSVDFCYLQSRNNPHLCKVHIFWEGHKIFRNLHCRFVLCSDGQIYSGDFAKFHGLLRIYELYRIRDVSLLLENQAQKGFFGLLAQWNLSTYSFEKICEFIEKEVWNILKEKKNSYFCWLRKCIKWFIVVVLTKFGNSCHSARWKVLILTVTGYLFCYSY